MRPAVFVVGSTPPALSAAPPARPTTSAAGGPEAAERLSTN